MATTNNLAQLQNADTNANKSIFDSNYSKGITSNSYNPLQDINFANMILDHANKNPNSIDFYMKMLAPYTAPQQDTSNDTVANSYLSKILGTTTDPKQIGQAIKIADSLKKGGITGLAQDYGQNGFANPTDDYANQQQNKGDALLMFLKNNQGSSDSGLSGTDKYQNTYDFLNKLKQNNPSGNWLNDYSNYYSNSNQGNMNLPVIGGAARGIMSMFGSQEAKEPALNRVDDLSQIYSNPDFQNLLAQYGTK